MRADSATECTSSMTDTEGKVHALGRVTPVAILARDIPVPQALAKGSSLQAEKIRDTMKPFVPGVKAFLGNERKTLSELHTHMSTKPAFQTAISDLNLKRAGGFLKSIRSMDSLEVRWRPLAVSCMCAFGSPQ